LLNYLKSGLELTLSIGENKKIPIPFPKKTGSKKGLDSGKLSEKICPGNKLFSQL
jgi:hypothetical protein